MNKTVIHIEHLKKRYRLGALGTGTFAGDLNRWLSKKTGRHTTTPETDNETLWALNGVDLSVDQGEILGIIGKNGAGKSSLLKVITKVTLPTEGSVHLKGRVASLLEVGTGFHPELSGRENIYLNGSILGMTKKEITRKFDEIVDFSGVDRFIDTPVKRYSSGMYVRLAFAVAAHLEPEILLVDEVLAVGDSEFQKKCLGKMNDVASSGRTILFVSHNMAAIRTLCTRAVVLENGHVAFDGPPRDAITHYLDHGTNTKAEVKAQELGLMADEAKPNRTGYFECNHISLAGPDGVPRGSFSSDEEITLIIKYDVLKTVPMFNIVVLVTTNEDDYVARTERLDRISKDESEKLQPGRYVSHCHFPANTFSERRYHITVNLQYHGIENLPYRNALSFDVSFLGYNHATLTQHSRRSALTRPLLDWTTTHSK